MLDGDHHTHPDTGGDAGILLGVADGVDAGVGGGGGDGAGTVAATADGSSGSADASSVTNLTSGAGGGSGSGGSGAGASSGGSDPSGSSSRTIRPITIYNDGLTVTQTPPSGRIDLPTGVGRAALSSAYAQIQLVLYRSGRVVGRRQLSMFELQAQNAEAVVLAKSRVLSTLGA